MLEILKQLLGIVRGDPWTFKSLASLVAKVAAWVADNLPEGTTPTPELQPLTEDISLEAQLHQAVVAFESNAVLSLNWKSLLAKLLEFALAKFVGG